MTSTASETTPETATSAATGKAVVKAPQGSAIQTQDGRVSVAEGVVTKIAGLACREITGIHAMGNGSSRAFGALRERLPGSSGPNVTQGVSVELGTTQVAIDLDVIVEYGVTIADLARAVQANVKESVERMTGLDVTEVNLVVGDVYLGEPEPESGRVD